MMENLVKTLTEFLYRGSLRNYGKKILISPINHPQRYIVFFLPITTISNFDSFFTLQV